MEMMGLKIPMLTKVAKEIRTANYQHGAVYRGNVFLEVYATMDRNI
jgi:hypothetical protein